MPARKVFALVIVKQGNRLSNRNTKETVNYSAILNTRLLTPYSRMSTMRAGNVIPLKPQPTFHQSNPDVALDQNEQIPFPRWFP